MKAEELKKGVRYSRRDGSVTVELVPTGVNGWLTDPETDYDFDPSDPHGHFVSPVGEEGPYDLVSVYEGELVA